MRLPIAFALGALGGAASCAIALRPIPPRIPTVQLARAITTDEARTDALTCRALVDLQQIPDRDRMPLPREERALDEIEAEASPLPVVEAIEVDTSARAVAEWTELGGE